VFAQQRSNSHLLWDTKLHCNLSEGLELDPVYLLYCIYVCVFICFNDHQIIMHNVIERNLIELWD